MICKERCWTLQKFYNLPLGEQEELLAFFQVDMAKQNYDSLKEHQSIEESSRKSKSPDDTQAYISKLRKAKQERQNKKAKKLAKNKKGE